MSLIIEFPKDLEAALASQAARSQMPTERYVAHIVGRAVERSRQRVSPQS